MRIVISTFVVLVLAAVGSQGIARGPGGRHAPVGITATFDRSEWTPPGRVEVELVTGRYTLTPAPSIRQQRAGIRVRTRHGRLPSPQVVRIAEATEAVLARGLADPTCRSGPDGQTIVISNAGSVMMRLAGAGGLQVTPERRECWSREAEHLYDVLEDVFGPQVYPRRR